MSKYLIVSRHSAAVAFIRDRLPEFAEAPVLTEARPEDVAGRIVAGNLPLHLAALADRVGAIEFYGPPPRGLEYGLAEMEAAGAHVAWYEVTPIKELRY